LKELSRQNLEVIFIFWEHENDSCKKDIIEIFGGEQPNAITQGEMHWFLDALFRGLFKILIKKGEKAPQNTNRR